MTHRLTISLVTWNSAHYIESLLRSLAHQTEKNLELIVTDNASTDDTVMLLSELLPTLPFPAALFREKENTGFARAHNHHIREAIRRKSRFILIVNPDCILEEHACAMLVQAIEADDRRGSVGGKILRAQFTVVNERAQLEKLPFLDSTGIVVTRSHAWLERGSGEHDRGQHKEGPTFGVTGAFALYRMRALMDVAFRQGGKREFFDEDFFSYNEDIDLAWRLQLFGWDAWYTPLATAWHHRTFGRERRAHVPHYLRALAWRNHFFVLLKNEDLANMFWALPLIFLRECAKFFWILFREPKTLQLFPDLFSLWFRMMQKRRWIMQHRRRSSPTMRQILRSSPSS